MVGDCREETQPGEIELQTQKSTSNSANLYVRTQDIFFKIAFVQPYILKRAFDSLFREANFCGLQTLEGSGDIERTLMATSCGIWK